MSVQKKTQLQSFLAGAWVTGSGRPAVLENPATEEAVAEAATGGLDLKKALEHARVAGGPALRALSFPERGERLKGLADRIHEERDALMECGIVNAGNTRSDAKFDVDGAAAVLAAYGELAQELGEGPWLPDGEKIALGSSERVAGRHVFVPIEGVAVLINAFNFPAWGLMEKAACAWLAGVPVLCKPATATALMAEKLARLTVDSGLLPDGAFSFLCGGAGDLLAHVDERDAVAFTGSGATGAWLRSLENVRARSVRVNVEADSLNAAILGADVEAGSETWDLFVNDVFRDMTQKAGQKCTAVRRIFVPEDAADVVKERLAARLAETKVGDPAIDGVRMGPLATRDARAAVRGGLAALEKSASVVFRGEETFLCRAGFEGKGYFQAPVLLEVAGGAAAGAVHDVEVFGPVATVIRYRDAKEMIAAVRRGGGGLVASIYTDDRAFLREAVAGVAAAHGRLFLGSKKVAGASPGPGTAMPQLQHGGPGRAGGGTELGGVRGLHFYMQRVALQGYGPLLDWLGSGTVT